MTIPLTALAKATSTDPERPKNTPQASSEPLTMSCAHFPSPVPNAGTHHLVRLSLLPDLLSSRMQEDP